MVCMQKCEKTMFVHMMKQFFFDLVHENQVKL
jgi:hypothetical protein